VKSTTLWLIVLIAFLSGTVSSISLAKLASSNNKTSYKVCYYDVVSRLPTCAGVNAKNYVLSGGCATFYPGEESVCGVLLITKNASVR
jgi:hypothetical protein